MESKTLQQGEKYLSCKMKTSKLLELFLEANREGKQTVDFAMFKNNSENPQAPDYKNEYCAVWINKKKEPSKTTTNNNNTEELLVEEPDISELVA